MLLHLDGGVSQSLASEPGVPRDVVAKLVNVVILKTSRTTTSIDSYSLYCPQLSIVLYYIDNNFVNTKKSIGKLARRENNKVTTSGH